MCDDKSTTQSQQQTSTYNPAASGALNDILGRAQSVASTPYSPYTGQLTAGLTPTQQGGINNINASYGTAQPYIDQAAGYAKTGASPITGSQIQNYENPFQNDVINSTMANINANNSQQRQALNGNAVAQGAFGGDRRQVAQGELARQQDLASNQTLAGLNSQNYQQALAAAQGDRSAAQTGAGQFATLGTTAQNANLQGAQAQIGAGTLEQQTNQAGLSAQYQQYLQQQAFPYQQAQFLASIGIPTAGALGGTTNSSGTKTTPGPTGAQQALGYATTAAGLFLKRGGRVPKYADGGPINFIDVPSFIPKVQINSPNNSQPQPLQWGKDEAQQSNPFDPKKMFGLGQDAAKLGNKVSNWWNSPGQAMDIGSGGNYSSIGDSWGGGGGGFGTSGDAIYSRGGSVHDDFISTVHSISNGLKNSRGGAVSPFDAGNAFADGGYTDSNSPSWRVASDFQDLNSLGPDDPEPADLGPLAAAFRSRYGSDQPTPVKTESIMRPQETATNIPLPSPRPSIDQPPPQNPQPDDTSGADYNIAATDPDALPGDALSYAQRQKPSANPFSNVVKPSADESSSGDPTSDAYLQQLKQRADQTTVPQKGQAGFSILKALGLGDGLSNEQKSGLLSTGLGILASKSPFASVAIGEGGQRGVEAMSGVRAEDEAKREFGINKDQEAKRLYQQALEHARSFGLQERQTKSLEELRSKPDKVTYKPYAPAPDGKGTILVGSDGSHKIDPELPFKDDTSSSAAPNNLTGQAYLDSLPPDRASRAKAIGDYNMSPKDLSIRKGGSREQAMSDAARYNKNYNESDFYNIQKARSNFAGGPIANTVRSFDVGIAHLDTLDRLGQALENKDMQAYNSIKNSFKSQFGYEAPGNFDAARQIVGAEIVKAIVGAGGGVSEREEAMNKLNNAKTPGQLHAIIQTYKTLMAGQLHGLRKQYEDTTKRNDFENRLSPNTVKELETASDQRVYPQPQIGQFVGDRKQFKQGWGVWDGKQWKPEQQ